MFILDPKQKKKIPVTNDLYVLIGLPGSGKSTFGKEFAKKHDMVYVSRDEVRYGMITEKEYYFSKEKDVYREYVLRITAGLDSGKDVIADATHLSFKSRDKLFTFLTREPCHKIAIYIDTPFDICFRRNQERKDITRVPDQQMFNMNRSLALPTAKEKFDNLLIYKDNQLYQLRGA